MKKRKLTSRTVRHCLLGGLGICITLAFLSGFFSSSAPDGLERVAIDEGFTQAAHEHTLSKSPLSGYSSPGIEDEKTGTGIAGAIGILASFAAVWGLLRVLSWRARPARSHPPRLTPESQK